MLRIIYILHRKTLVFLFYFIYCSNKNYTRPALAFLNDPPLPCPTGDGQWLDDLDAAVDTLAEPPPAPAARNMPAK